LEEQNPGDDINAGCLLIKKIGGLLLSESFSTDMASDNIYLYRY